jgi:hypothetical protein
MDFEVFRVFRVLVACFLLRVKFHSVFLITCFFIVVEYLVLVQCFPLKMVQFHFQMVQFMVQCSLLRVPLFLFRVELLCLFLVVPRPLPRRSCSQRLLPFRLLGFLLALPRLSLRRTSQEWIVLRSTHVLSSKLARWTGSWSAPAGLRRRLRLGGLGPMSRLLARLLARPLGRQARLPKPRLLPRLRARPKQVRPRPQPSLSLELLQPLQLAMSRDLTCLLVVFLSLVPYRAN